MAVIALSVLALVVCHGAPQQNATLKVAAPELYSAAPNDTELQVILSDFEKYAERGRKDWQVPGMAVAIVRGNDTIYMHSFGVKNISGTDPITNDTIFMIGSTSKAFTAALVAMQVDEGKIKWDDKVIDHLPDFRMYDPWVTREFTVTDLMAQRSGMPAYAGDEAGFLGYDRQHIMHSIRYIKPVTSFRSAYAYENSLFLWAAAIVENLTGESWENNLQQRIFLPLGMSNSSDDLKSLQQARNVAFPHIMSNGSAKALPIEGKFLGTYYTYGPAGGINSNVIDMAKWLRLQINNGTYEGRQIINESSMVYMRTPKTIIGTNPITDGYMAYYCQGWAYQEFEPYPMVWHNGEPIGHHSMIAFIPQAKVGIVVLSNAGYTELPEALAFKFFDMYFGNPGRDWSAQLLAQSKETEALANASTPKPPASPSPAMPMSSYVGNYSNDLFGSFNIMAQDSGLIITAGPSRTQIFLSPWSRDTFKASVPDISDQAGFAVFQMDPEDRAKSMTIDLFEGATFNRA
jgi:CubicO group peptidase (beta-lactamase class C family)